MDWLSFIVASVRSSVGVQECVFCSMGARLVVDSFCAGSEWHRMLKMGEEGLEPTTSRM